MGSDPSRCGDTVAVLLPLAPLAGPPTVSVLYIRSLLDGNYSVRMVQSPPQLLTLDSTLLAGDNGATPSLRPPFVMQPLPPP